MNSYKSLKDLHIKWTDLLRTYEGASDIVQGLVAIKPRSHPPIPSGIYNQSSKSPIVDELRELKTMGQCYTKMIFEAKIKD